MVEKFALLISCVGHDLEHTGKSNAFEVASMSRLAIRYNDESVLENHHVSQLFKILAQEKSNIMSSFSEADISRVRKLCISNIICTDMKKHFELLKQFETKLIQRKEENIPIISNDESKRYNDVRLLQGFLVHSCDLSAPSKDFPIAKAWSIKISEEFTAQVEQEKQLQIPISQHMVGLTNLETIAKQEVIFIKVIIKPVWVMMNDLVPEKMKMQLDNTNINMEKWQQTYEEEKKENEEN